ncbi:unnamed protein product [Durusdinium trenchii]|uniref:Uncharacterized protein n=1 Tax=Durusdinium trenchii TaxID=1381693 RepID=A0ABP0KVE9_9DINO
MWSRTSNALLDRSTNAQIMWTERVRKERRRLGLEKPGGPTTADLLLGVSRVAAKEPANSRRAAQRKALPRPPELFEKAFVDLHHRRIPELHRAVLMEWRNKRVASRSSSLPSLAKLHGETFEPYHRYQIEEPRLARLERIFQHG